jgi:hypothetical protein
VRLQQAASSLVALICAETWAANGKPTSHDGNATLAPPLATARALPQLRPQHRLEDPIDNRKLGILLLCWQKFILLINDHHSLLQLALDNIFIFYIGLRN